MEKGIVKRIIGPVVDVHFPAGSLPEIYYAVEVPLEGRKVVLEVVQQIGGGDVRCIALASTDGISRGCEAYNTGSSITMHRGLYHAFWGEAGQGDMVVGEVSKVNDDKLIIFVRRPPTCFHIAVCQVFCQTYRRCLQ